MKIEEKTILWKPVSEYTGGRVLATNGLDILVGELNPEGDCVSEDCSGIHLCGITHFAKIAGFFPELKESEDERIRNQIINFIEEYGNPIHCEWQKDWIAWLEKQGDKDKLIKELGEYKVKYTQEVLSQQLEKQGEQKPTDKTEPKFKVKYADSEYNVLEVKDIAGVTFYGIEDEPNHIDYVKADNCEIISGYGIKESGLSFPTKPVMFSEQNPAWSEEDETMTTNIIIMLKEGASLHFNKKDIAKGVDWLKSLKPQNHWKPTEAQLASLRIACDRNDRVGFDLTQLLKELKEL